MNTKNSERSSFRIFIVEDDPWYGELLKYHLELNPDNEVTLFSDGQSCLKQLHQNPDAVTIDFMLPDMTGEELLQKIREFNDQIPLIVISGQTEIQVAVGLLKKGASDYLVKDDHTREFLWNSIEKFKKTAGLHKEVERLKEQLGERFDFGKMLTGQSPAMQKVYSLSEKALRTNINVSISGETGTGKEMVAKAIHFNGSRAKKPFVAVNMSAIPRELAESELFGHEKGAFTGAESRRKGKFEEANGGTLFLDEIAEMDSGLQSKLLRVLQEREIVRVGGNEVIKLDVRIISATHKDLSEEVRKGAFREDLFFRLMGLPIEMPALRDRGNDLLLLSKNFIEDFARENKMPVPKLSAPAREKLFGYSFPGNVRELKAVLELAVVLCDGREIQPDDLQLSSVIREPSLIAKEKTLREYQSEIIQHFLDKYNSNVIEVAKKLDIGKSTIYNLLKSGDVILKK